MAGLFSPLNIVLYVIIFAVVDVVAHLLRVGRAIAEPDAAHLAGLVEVKTGARCPIHGDPQGPEEQNGLDGDASDPFFQCQKHFLGSGLPEGCDVGSLSVNCLIVLFR